MSMPGAGRAMPADAEPQLEFKHSVELKQRTFKFEQPPLKFEQQLVELTSNSIDSAVATFARTTPGSV
jgi:hypothetical protein